MFIRVPDDVSEIVVVYSKSYALYREMKQIVKKFNDECVEERILDKLTIKTKTNDGIFYQLGEIHYRSYDKPLFINLIYSDMYYIYQWSNLSNRCDKLNMPYMITFVGDRYYDKRKISEKSYAETYDSCIYSLGNLAIYQSGQRRFLGASYSIHGNI